MAGLAVAAAACLMGMPAAQAQNEMSPEERQVRCSEAILRGAYAVRGEGYLRGPAGDALLPWAIVSLMNIDVAGSLSNKVSASFNGRIQQNTVAGSYTVNADCTGTITVILPAPPFQLNFDLVVAEARGSDAAVEFYFISTDAGTAITHTARRIR